MEPEVFNPSFTKEFQKSLSRAESVHLLTLLPIYLRCILLLSFHPHRGLPRDMLPFGLSVKILKKTSTSSHSGYMPFQPKSFIFNHSDCLLFMEHVLRPKKLYASATVTAAPG